MKAATDENWEPSLLTTFVPTTAMLLRVGSPGWREILDDPESPHHRVPFDPWKRGDPVFVQVKDAKGERWRYGTRASTPTENILKIDVGGKALVRIYGAGGIYTLWRIPYRWRKAAAKLAGTTFASREEVEINMRAVG